MPWQQDICVALRTTNASCFNALPADQVCVDQHFVGGVALNDPFENCRQAVVFRFVGIRRFLVKSTG